MKVIKKPIHLTYSYIEEDCVIQTLEGPVNAGDGHVLLTGTKGEQWPIPINRFALTYETLSYDKELKTGKCFKMPIEVEAQQMDKPFSVKVSWNEDLLHGNPGDYLVTYGPDDFGVVAKEIFNETYEVVSE